MNNHMTKMIVERYTITSCRKVVPKSAKRISQ